MSTSKWVLLGLLLGIAGVITYTFIAAKPLSDGVRTPPQQ